MNEILESMQEEMREKALTGCHHKASRLRGMTQVEMQKKNGPVITTIQRKLPDLPSVRDRILWTCHGMKQIEVARKVGICQSSVNRIFNSTGTYGDSTLIKFANAFDVPLDWLKWGSKKTPDAAQSDVAEDAEQKNFCMLFTMKDQLLGEQIRQIVFPVMDGVKYEISIEVRLAK